MLSSFIGFSFFDSLLILQRSRRNAKSQLATFPKMRVSTHFFLHLPSKFLSSIVVNWISIERQCRSECVAPIIKCSWLLCVFSSGRAVDYYQLRGSTSVILHILTLRECWIYWNKLSISTQLACFHYGICSCALSQLSTKSSTWRVLANELRLVS